MPDKILVVDDEPDILNLAKMILEGEGYEVAVASNGKEAVQKAESQEPDLILLDVVMPGRNGFEVCQALKAGTRTGLVPVVMFTALGRDVDRKLSAESGADGHLVKPFTPEGLLAEVQKQLQKARLERFSKALGLTHAQLRGRKVLLEFDPATPYQRAVRDFVFEARAHGESVLVLTPKASVVRHALQGEDGVEFVALTHQVIFTTILTPYEGKPLALVFDNLTDLVFYMGFQPAYNFTRGTLEKLAEQSITALFLFSPNAHPPSETYTVRNLFSEQVTYGAGGLIKVKLT
ncbi:MAG: response regulator [Candidatus Bathyarchaeia archaeon]